MGTKSTAKKVAIYDVQPTPAERFHVHAEGCADTARGRFRGVRPDLLEASTRDEVVGWMNADFIDPDNTPEELAEELAYYSQEFKFYPCCGLS